MPKKPISAPKCGIGSNRAKGVRRRAEKNVIDLGFGLVGDGGDLVRNGEDNVEVLGIEQFGFTILQPLGAPAIGTWDSSANGTNCTRRVGGHSCRTARHGRPVPRCDKARWQSWHGAVPLTAKCRAAVGRLRRSGGTRPPLLTIRPPLGPQLRRVRVGTAPARRRPVAAASPAGWMSNRFCWWRSADNGP
jgi:hypothetical protein